MIDEQLRIIIEDSEVVSFDIFDTLIRRHHFRPTDVFTEIDDGKLFPFRIRRIIAERLARIRFREKEDVTLSQIYSSLKLSSHAEIDAEFQSCHANSLVKPIYDYAVKANKRLIAISDMYLPESVLRALLKKNGFPAVSHIYVSSEIGKTKASTNLFSHVISELKITPKKILHIGDNRHSDFNQSLLMGIRAHHIPSPSSAFQDNTALHPYLLKKLNYSRNRDHSLLMGLFRDCINDYQHANRYWYDLGVTIVGPIANAFVDWIARQAISKNHQTVFFLARDGYLPLEIFRLRHPEISAQYTYASRRLFIVPALATEVSNPAVLDGLCGGLPGTPAMNYWHRLRIHDPDIEARLDAVFPDGKRISSLQDQNQLRDFFKEVHPQLRVHGVTERKRLNEYLNSIGLSNTKANPLIVDIGWKASSQRYLEIAIPGLQGTAGAYFGLSPGSYDNENMHGFLFERGIPSKAYKLVMHCVEIIELMFSAPEASVVGLERENELYKVYTAIREPITSSESQRISIISEIQRGALAFTRQLHELEKKGLKLSSKIDVEMLLYPTIMNPTERDLKNLGNLPHSLGLGSDRYETILPTDLPKNLVELILQYFGSNRTQMYWPRGLVNSMRFHHGALSGLSTRVATTAYALALTGRTIARRILKP